MLIEDGSEALPDQPTVDDIYGYAFRAGEEAGGRPGVARLIYEFSTGALVSEDVTRYFADQEYWWPGDVLACGQAAGRVLVVGCGVGRHATAVAQAGHDVVGLDPSSQAVAVARRRGVDARIGGIPDLPDGLGTFDTFLFAGGGLFLLSGPNGQKALRALAEVANRGARIVGTNVIPFVDETGTSTRDSSRQAGPVRHRMRVKHGSRLTAWSRWEPIDRPTMAQLEISARDTGWSIEETHRTVSPFAPELEHTTNSAGIGDDVMETGSVAVVMVRMRLVG
ncbi:hypothetical protein ALI144C_36445 [Actinosynnema sp. ALI-1.44]|uniref:class I SAM-dependent methyltransferase n=1 Tax=Actinosynnema sp. ALI-1.44 TaxID=1933779 RepID=UPI00097BD7A2|nr:class I SAM-dependent methyltransferase [Actinosynnema sp. ALI-1.44]ONI76169.1 hypothetical protein ALI144C_36445 [Actinosynnema sp. ALI-1.44]